MSFRAGDRIAGYEVTGVIGAGGMGRVYRVRNLISDRVEAMKALLSDLEEDPGLAERFLREIKLQARLNHPNIVSLHNALKAEGRLVMVLELVDGEALAKKLRAGRLPLSEAVDYTRQALEGLAYAHAQEVIHRDIKPSNMMVASGGVLKLMDFGIAKALSEKTITASGSVIGSLHYMSPEQVRGGPIDPRTDLYSLGVVLYEMATGRRPFEGDSEYLIMNAHLERPPAPPAEVDASVPARLSEVILTALAKDPAQRFPDADSFRRALEEAVKPPAPRASPPAERPIPAPPPSPPIAHAPASPLDPASQRTDAPGQGRETAPAAGPAEAKRRPQPAPARAASKPAQPRGRKPGPSTAVLVGSAVGTFVLVFGGYLLLDRISSDPSPEGPPSELAVRVESPATIPAEPQPQPSADGAAPSSPEGAGAPADAGRSSSPGPSKVREPEPAEPAPPAEKEPEGTSRAEGSPAPPAEKPTPAGDKESAPKKPAAEAPKQPEPQDKAVDKAPGGSSQKPASQKETRAGDSHPAPASPASQPEQKPASSDSEAGKPASPPASQATGKILDPAPDPEPQIPESSQPAQAAQAAPASRVYELSEVSPPQLVHRVPPQYTAAARRARVEGVVRLEAEIWPDGKAHNIRVIRSIGHPELDQNAVEAFQQWVFGPALKDGKPVKVRVTADLKFELF